jgi:hypothetical protein
VSHRFAMVPYVLPLSIANFGRGRKGAFELTSLIRKRNQTNQLQAKLLTSGPGGRRFKSSLPRPIFLESINYEHKKRDFGAEFGSSKLPPLKRVLHF